MIYVRSVGQVVRGVGDPGQAEALMLQEARERDPRDLFRWGLGLVHQLAPQEMVAEEERREERREQRRYLRLINGVLGRRRKLRAVPPTTSSTPRRRPRSVAPRL